MAQGSAEPDDQFVCNTLVQSVLNLIEDENFGEITVSTEVECDRAVAKYASEVKDNVLAVVGSDTDMLIFEGDFSFWVIESIEQVKECKANHLDRKKLLNELGLSRDEMKIFATIRGNDFTRRFLNYKTDMLNYKIANHIKTLRNCAYNVKEIGKVMRALSKGSKTNRKIVVSDDLMKSIKTSLKYYTLDFKLQQSAGNFNLFKSCMENGYVLQYDVQFMDFNPRKGENKKFIDFILEAFQRMLGILKWQQPDNEHLSELEIITKTDKNNDYHRVKLPLLPPTLLWVESENIKWKYLHHGLGLQLAVDDLKTIAKQQQDIVMSLFAIMFLLQANEITKRHADILLLMHCNILMQEPTLKFLKELPIPEPCRYDYDIVCTAQAFHKAFSLVTDFFDVCDLHQYKHSVSYDGVYYNYLMTESFTLDRHALLKKCLKQGVKEIYDRFKCSLRYQLILTNEVLT